MARKRTKGSAQARGRSLTTPPGAKTVSCSTTIFPRRWDVSPQCFSPGRRFAKQKRDLVFPTKPQHHNTMVSCVSRTSSPSPPMVRHVSPPPPKPSPPPKPPRVDEARAVEGVIPDSPRAAAATEALERAVDESEEGACSS